VMLAGWGFVGIAGALGVGIDVTEMFLPLVLVPLVFALLVAVGGRSLIILAVSMCAAILFAGLGAWNFFNGPEFERLHPGSVDISGHDVSLVFVLLAATAAVWSLGASVLLVRARWLDQPDG
jgi:hypothetical protein